MAQIANNQYFENKDCTDFVRSSLMKIVTFLLVFVIMFMSEPNGNGNICNLFCKKWLKCPKISISRRNVCTDLVQISF